jgi:glycogen(starch) synthase
MKVLMFGWEFPPHISGGLGTACYGLTHSLHQQGVHVLFVIPKLFGGETHEKVSLINASNVSAVPAKSTKKHFSTTQFPESITVKGKREASASFTTIPVASALSPYHSTHFHQQSDSISRWNYTFPLSHEVQHDVRTEQEQEEESAEEKKTTFAFSGTYGPNLLEEVGRYADVAEQVASGNSFEVIHAHDWPTFPAGIAAKKISGKPLIVHIHATEFDRAGEQVDPAVFAIEYEGLKQADRIIAVSQWTRDILISRYKIQEDKIEVVHNGITPEIKKLLPKSSPLGPHIVTFMGRITYQKGPRYFVEAAKKVLEEFPDAHFVMAGSGDLLPQIIENVARLKMSSRFHFTGFLKKNEIDKIWALTNVYVMPSVSEPFGITPLEAIQGGVPVIVSRQSGVAEVMPHAIKVDFWNTRALAGSICSILRYGSLSRSLKKNGREEVRHMTWEKAAKKINNVYHELTTTP